MAESPSEGVALDVVCPHCKKPFEAVLMDGSAGRFRGFKCPHCRLFVPYERVGELPLATATEPS